MLRSDDGNSLPHFSDALKLYGSIGECKQRVVSAFADVCAGMKVRASLPHKNSSGEHFLSAEPLNPKTLRVAVASVTGASAPFFMSHILSFLFSEERPLLYYRCNFYMGVLFPVSALYSIALAFLLLENDDLFILHVGDVLSALTDAPDTVGAPIFIALSSDNKSTLSKFTLLPTSFSSLGTYSLSAVFTLQLLSGDLNHCKHRIRPS